MTCPKRNPDSVPPSAELPLPSSVETAGVLCGSAQRRGQHAWSHLLHPTVHLQDAVCPRNMSTPTSSQASPGTCHHLPAFVSIPSGSRVALSALESCHFSAWNCPGSPHSLRMEHSPHSLSPAGDTRPLGATDAVPEGWGGVGGASRPWELPGAPSSHPLLCASPPESVLQGPLPHPRPHPASPLDHCPLPTGAWKPERAGGLPFCLCLRLRKHLLPAGAQHRLDAPALPRGASRALEPEAQARGGSGRLRWDPGSAPGICTLFAKRSKCG